MTTRYIGKTTMQHNTTSVTGNQQHGNNVQHQNDNQHSYMYTSVTCNQQHGSIPLKVLLYIANKRFRVSDTKYLDNLAKYILIFK